MHVYPPPPIFRIRLSAPGGEDPRPHPKAAHPPSVVAQARHLVETTPHTYRTIATRTGVNHGTIARWVEKYGWKRPPGAWPGHGRPERRYVPVPVGRVQATRLRIQAERLIREIERAPAVDPAALAEALSLLERARAEQQIRRTKKRMPPPEPPRSEGWKKAELDPVTRERVGETRRLSATKAWVTRWATQPKPPKWTQAGGAAERAIKAKRRRERQRDREFEKTLPSPHLGLVTKPDYERVKWDRRAAAIKGWKKRYARMREAGRER
jgi:hypothetical protein